MNLPAQAAGTVLVTGGAGFIGSRTVESLLAQGLRVRVLDNLSTGRRENLRPSDRLELVVGDIRDAATVGTAMQGVDRVLHLAAQASVALSIIETRDSASSNISGFLNVLDASRDPAIRRVVYGSSAAVFGNPVVLPLTESSVPRPVSPYGVEKLANDEYSRIYHEIHGLSVLGMRYFNVYGAGQDASSPTAGVLAKFADRVRRGLPLTVHGDGTQRRDFIHVRDVAEANRRALFSGACGVVNVGTGTGSSINDVVALLAVLGEGKPRILHAPRPAGDTGDSIADIRRMREWLGEFDLIPLRRGLEEMLAPP